MKDSGTGVSPAERESGKGPIRLRRVLTFWDLVLFGIICVTPIAPLPPFGIAEKLSDGHATLTVFIAMFAMLVTAVSYGRMAGLYPEAGSAYTYVSRGLNPHVGFLAGWATFLDYLIIPVANVIYCAATMYRLAPQVPYAAWALVFAALATWLNLRGVRTGARVNQSLMALMVAVLVVFVTLAVRYLLNLAGWGALFSTTPFFNPATFDFNKVRTATSFAALTYIGFDAVTTLSEEVKDPRRTVPRATVVVCLFTGIVGGGLVYLTHLVWPDYRTFSHIDTAFLDVTRRVGGLALFEAMGVVIILAQFGSALTGQAGAARLLFGMGRKNALPQGFFGHVDPRRQVPTFNVLLVGCLALGGAMIFDFEQAAEVLNFGAFLAFMGVNLAVIRKFYLEPERQRRRLVSGLLLPLSGFLFCFAIWISLPGPAKRIGWTWLALGFAYHVLATRGFRRPPPEIDLSDA
jgi:amino acid transporter